MATQTATKEDEGKFLVASHDTVGTRVYRGHLGESDIDLVIGQGEKVVIDDRWNDVSSFVRDVQKGIIKMWRTDTPPDVECPKVSHEYHLTPTQEAFVANICYHKELSDEVKARIKIHTVLGKGGVTMPGSSVSKKYVTVDHAQTLRAALDLETRYRNRPAVKKLLSQTLKEIEAL